MNTFVLGGSCTVRSKLNNCEYVGWQGNPCTVWFYIWVQWGPMPGKSLCDDVLCIMDSGHIGSPSKTAPLHPAGTAVISTKNEDGSDIQRFQKCTWLRPISCWKICEYQSDPQVYWKNSNVALLSLQNIFSYMNKNFLLDSHMLVLAEITAVPAGCISSKSLIISQFSNTKLSLILGNVKHFFSRVWYFLLLSRTNGFRCLR